MPIASYYFVLFHIKITIIIALLKKDCMFIFWRFASLTLPVLERVGIGTRYWLEGP